MIKKPTPPKKKPIYQADCYACGGKINVTLTKNKMLWGCCYNKMNDGTYCGTVFKPGQKAVEHIIEECKNAGIDVNKHFIEQQRATEKHEQELQVYRKKRKEMLNFEKELQEFQNDI